MRAFSLSSGVALPCTGNTDTNLDELPMGALKAFHGYLLNFALLFF